jgi:hypothetical protein
MFLEYPNQKTKPTLGGEEKDPTHSAVYGIQFQAKCKAVGVPCELVYPGNPGVKHQTISAFLIDHLK